MRRHPASPFEVSVLDLERFGRRIVKSVIAAEGLEETLQFCERDSVDLLIARADVRDAVVIHALEESGARLMDTLVAFQRDLAAPVPELVIPPGVELGQAGPEDAEQVAALVRQSFNGYVGHYHRDPRLPDEACTEVYASWAARCCEDRDVADEVQLAYHNGQLAGMSALKLNGRVAEGILDAVSPQFRNLGIHRALAVARLRRAVDKGATQMLMTGHLANFTSQRAWQGIGFTSCWAQHTFHLWFDQSRTAGRSGS